MQRNRLIGLILTICAMASINLAQAFNAKDVTALVDSLTTPAASSRPFAAGANYKLCFVPDGASCEALLVGAIRAARQNILVQAYSFTNPAIAKALVDAHKRGIDVRVIVDKSQVSERYTSATFLKNAGISVVVDWEPAIAHNKLLLIDQRSVFTGSFNFSRSAQTRNTENGILIHGDQALAKAYVDNWVTRYNKSRAY